MRPLASRGGPIPGRCAAPDVRSVRQKLDVGALYRGALRAMREVIDRQAPLPVAQVCAPTLEELLSDHRTGRRLSTAAGRLGKHNALAFLHEAVTRV